MWLRSFNRLSSAYWGHGGWRGGRGAGWLGSSSEGTYSHSSSHTIISYRHLSDTSLQSHMTCLEHANSAHRALRVGFKPPNWYWSIWRCLPFLPTLEMLPPLPRPPKSLPNQTGPQKSDSRDLANQHHGERHHTAGQGAAIAGKNATASNLGGEPGEGRMSLLVSGAQYLQQPHATPPSAWDTQCLN